MVNKREYIKVSFEVIGFSLGIVFLYLLFRKADPISIARIGAVVSVCSAIVKVINGRGGVYVPIYLLFLLLFSVVLIAIEIKVFIYVIEFTALLAATLWIPYLLILLVYRLPIKAIYKKAFLASLLSIMPLLVFGRWGNAIQTLFTILFAIPLYYFIAKISHSKERWVCLAIFVIVFTVFSFLFGSVEKLFKNG